MLTPDDETPAERRARLDEQRRATTERRLAELQAAWDADVAELEAKATARAEHADARAELAARAEGLAAETREHAPCPSCGEPLAGYAHPTCTDRTTHARWTTPEEGAGPTARQVEDARREARP